jgi:hypothetical protein
MNDEKKTYVIKRRDVADIIHSGDPEALELFLDEPTPIIAHAIIDLFAHGPVALVGPGVRIVQGALKGNLFKQLAKEVDRLREKGQIDDSFGERKYGFQSWVELLTIIDEDTPDADRLDALKAMFFSINRVNATDADQILGYQLFQVAKRLNSNELLVLKAVYELVGAKRFRPGLNSFNEWAAVVSKHLGHSLVSLIEHADKLLVANLLLTGRVHPDRSGIQEGGSGHLTDQGLKFCQNIELYRVDRSS